MHLRARRRDVGHGIHVYFDKLHEAHMNLVPLLVSFHIHLHFNRDHHKVLQHVFRPGDQQWIDSKYVLWFRGHSYASNQRTMTYHEFPWIIRHFHALNHVEMLHRLD